VLKLSTKTKLLIYKGILDLSTGYPQVTNRLYTGY